MTGFWTLLRLALRRERLRIPVYVAVLAGLIASTAAQSETLYPTAADRADYAASVAANPGLIALVGPTYAVTNVGGDVAWQWGGFGAVIAALMSMFVLGRHTRAEEQSGRSELVRASAVGLQAPTAAAMAVAVGANVLAGAAVMLVMLAAGEPLAGSAAFGASLAGVGLFFAGVSGVAMQLAQGTSGAYGIVGGVLGLAYALRAAGDVGDGTLSWLSPIGWSQSMRPYAGERWWPLLLLLAGTAVLVAATFALRARRDEGEGVVAQRPGPPEAGPSLAHPFGLALRLQRGALIGWTTGLFLGGLSIGLTAQDADDLLGSGDSVDALFGQTAGSLIDNYIAVSLLSFGLIGTGFAIQVILRMRSEETSGRLEPLLATALARPRWAAGFVAVSAVGSLVALAATGLGAGIADAVESHDAVRIPVLMGSAAALAPAMWVVAGVAVALFGLLPRAVAAAWGVLAACFLVSFLGPLLSLPDWVLDLSPYGHVPLLPAADLDVVPLLVLTAIAAAFTAAGLAGFRRRDVPV